MKRLRLAESILDAIDEVRQLVLHTARRDCRVTVCFKSASGEIFGHMDFPSFEHANELVARLKRIGYGVSILHPEATGCDFVFEDLTPPSENLNPPMDRV